jgi:hypothetical protein
MNYVLAGAVVGFAWWAADALDYWLAPVAASWLTLVFVVACWDRIA